MGNVNFKNKKVLVTGSTGFIGSALTAKLKKLGATVYGVSQKLDNSKFNLKANILDGKKINDFIKGNKINICFHLAAQSLVESGQDDPYKTFKVNTEGTLNILESARVNNLERVIVASTSHVYGRNKAPYFEGYMPRPSRPYETSKACTDLIAQSYAETFNLPVLIPRFVNIYGPGDKNYTRLIPKTIKSVLQGKSPKMWGGGAIRDYLFIDDALDAFLKLSNTDLKILEKNRVFNFGSNNLISVRELIDKIIFHSGKKLKVRKISDEREGEVKIQYVSSKKAKRIFDWEAKISLDKGLRDTILWHKEIMKI